MGVYALTDLGAKTRPFPQTDTERLPLYSYYYIVRHGLIFAIWRPIRTLQMADGKIYMLANAQHINSIKCITCSHRNNLTQDNAHYRDPCNIPAEREGDRVKGLRDTDRWNDRFTQIYGIHT